MQEISSSEVRMEVKFTYLPEFERRAKVLAKKYKSFVADYQSFLDLLEKNPYQGVALGGGVYKNRMQISSKGKGKSGGARVITYNVQSIEQGHIKVTLMTIFDKNEMENISDAYLKSLVKEIRK